MKRLIKYLKPYFPYLILALFSGVITVASNLTIPILIGKAIDEIKNVKNIYFEKLIYILMLLVIILMIGAISAFLMTYFLNRLSYLGISDLRNELFQKINKLPLKTIDQKSHGDYVSAVVVDVDIISESIVQGFSQLFTGILTIVGTLIFMISINKTIALIVIILTPLSLFAASIISKKSFEKFKEQSKIRAEMTGFVEEMVTNARVVKTLNMDRLVENNFNKMNEVLYDCGQKSQFYSSLTNPTTRFINGIIYAVVGVVGALNVISKTAGSMSIGGLTSFLAYAGQYTKPFNEISTVLTELQSANASADRVFKILDIKEEGEEWSETKFELTSPYKIEFNKVSFSYDGEKKIIDKLSLVVKEGEKVAIKGPTGCGKTTLINLLLRFYEIDEGEIKINGVDIRLIKKASLRKMFGMVLQDTWIFKGSVYENIAYGTINKNILKNQNNKIRTEELSKTEEPSKTKELSKKGTRSIEAKPDYKEEVIKAAKAANAHNFIMKLENGYDTIISEEDDNLSLGQKQLICIARVMYVRPEILILDEATSNIDTLTEKRVQKAFDSLMKNRTSFVVAHRLSTLKGSDNVIDMGKQF